MKSKEITNSMMFLGETYKKAEAVENSKGKYIELKTDEGYDYNDYLIALFKGSTTHHAVIRGMSDYIFGNGLTGLGSDLFSDEDLRRTALDLKLFNRYSFQCIWNRAGTQIVRVKHLPVSNIRLDTEMNGYWYSDNWASFRKKQYTPIHFPKMGLSERDKPQIFLYQPYVLGSSHYSLPDYMGCIQYVDLEIEIANFHNSNIKNGFAASSIINFNNGIPDESTRKKIEQSANDKWSGSSNAGRLIVTFNQDKEHAAELLSAPISDLDKQYEFLTSESALKIMTGHRVTSPMLFGIKSDTGLGNNADELKNAFNLLNETVIEGYRRQIEFGVNDILEVGNVPHETVTFVPYTPDFDGLSQVLNEEGEEVTNDVASTLGTLSPLVATKVLDSMTEDEVRDIVKLKPSDETVIIEENTGGKEGFNHNLSSEYPSTEDMLSYMDSIPYELDSDYGPDWYIRQTDDKNGTINFDEKSIEKTVVSTKSDARLKSRLDGANYTIRFKYTGPLQNDSRDFCKVMQTQNKNRSWRIEDISKLSLSGANSDMNQRKKYSIFEIKGLWQCKHYWTAVQRVRQTTNPEPILTINEAINSDPFSKKLWSNAKKVNPTTDGWVTSKSGYKRKT